MPKIQELRNKNMSHENEMGEQNEAEQKVTQLGSQLHGEWQTQFQKDNPSHQDRFKPADDPNFDIRFSDESSFTQTGEVTLNRPLDELQVKGKEEKLAAAMKKQQIVKAKLSEDGKMAKGEDGKIYIDILNTGYDNLSEKWKGENKSSAEVTVTEIEKAVQGGVELDDAFVESASSVLHDKWLERNGSWAPEEQKKPYAELSEEEKEKDRVIIRKGIAMYAKKEAGDEGRVSLVDWDKESKKEKQSREDERFGARGTVKIPKKKS